MQLTKKVVFVMICFYGTICTEGVKTEHDEENYVFARAVEEFSNQADVFVSRVTTTIETAKKPESKKQKISSVVFNETCAHCESLCQLGQLKA